MLHVVNYLEEHRKICYIAASAAMGILLQGITYMWQAMAGIITWSEMLDRMNLLGDAEKIVTNWIMVGGSVIITTIINVIWSKIKKIKRIKKWLE